jgi:CheY-like chemotaxis protein
MMPKILLVDDVRQRLEFGAALLRRLEMTVFTAETAAEAIAAARAQRFDLVVLELEMVREDGPAACKVLRTDHHTCHVPLLVLAPPGKEDVARRAGADHLLARPLAEASLRGEVERLLALVGRAAPRVCVDTPVWFWRDGEPASGRLIDLSRTGFFTATPEPQPLGARIEVSFTLPHPYSGRKIGGEAIVVRRTYGDGKGFGCRFFQVTSASQRFIEEFLERAAPRPGA